jgi:5-methylcytosine-specific restriction endonuclease McrA
MLVIMARKFAKSFYNSKAWKDCQSAYKAFKLGICERCGGADGTEVHHKIMLNENNINDPNIALNFNNLELLCKTCHAQHHNRKHGFVRNDVCFDDNGDLIKKPETQAGRGLWKTI